MQGLWEVGVPQGDLPKTVSYSSTRLPQVLQPAARAVPLTRLALDAFDKAGVGQGPDGSDTGIRALRIGVDARFVRTAIRPGQSVLTDPPPPRSLWIFHARTVAGGSNPLLRTLMFRTLKLLAHPVAPVFVFGASLFAGTPPRSTLH